MPRRDTKTAIIEAAVTVLGRDGPNGFSAAGLAREVGVSKATLFHHFASIDEIPIQAFEHMISESLEIDIPANAGLSDIIAALGAGNFALVEGRRDFLNAYFVFMARAMFDPKLAAMVHKSGEALLERMQTLLRPHVGSHEEAVAMARLVAMFLDGQAIHLMAFDDRAEIEQAWLLFGRLADPERRRS